MLRKTIHPGLLGSYLLALFAPLSVPVGMINYMTTLSIPNSRHQRGLKNIYLLPTPHPAPTSLPPLPHSTNHPSPALLCLHLHSQFNCWRPVDTLRLELHLLLRMVDATAMV